MNKNTPSLDTVYDSPEYITVGTVGNTINVADFAHLVLQIDTQGSACFRIRFQGSCSDTAPTFSSAQSRTNVWEYISSIDLDTTTSITGIAGLTFAAADYKLIKLGYLGNPVALKWINMSVVDYSAGSLYMSLLKSNNV